MTAVQISAKSKKPIGVVNGVLKEMGFELKRGRGEKPDYNKRDTEKALKLLASLPEKHRGRPTKVQDEEPKVKKSHKDDPKTKPAKKSEEKAEKKVEKKITKPKTPAKPKKPVVEDEEEDDAPEVKDDDVVDMDEQETDEEDEEEE